MKLLTTILTLSLSTQAFGKMLCEKQGDGKEICYRNPDVDLNGPYQARYDDSMKTSGKWSFLSNTFFLFTFASLGATYYGLDKMQKYEDIKEERDLTPEEQLEYNKWNGVAQGGAGATAGCLLFGLVSYGLEVHYENQAHNFALQIGTSW